MPRVFDHLGISDVAELFPMDGNDTVGDCTIAALAHAITLFRGFVAKKPSIMPAAQVLKLYYRLSGGVDSGLAELNVLNYWRQHKVSGDPRLREHRPEESPARSAGGVALRRRVP